MYARVVNEASRICEVYVCRNSDLKPENTFRQRIHAYRGETCCILTWSVHTSPPGMSHHFDLDANPSRAATVVSNLDRQNIDRVYKRQYKAYPCSFQNCIRLNLSKLCIPAVDDATTLGSCHYFR